MSWSWERTGQAYGLVLTPIAGGYEFYMRDNRFVVRLKIKAISAMFRRTGLTNIHQAKTKIY